MSDTLTSDPGQAARRPGVPMERTSRCPFAPPREVMELAAAAPLSGCGSGRAAPVADHRLRGARSLFADARVSVDDRAPGFPHWNEPCRPWSTSARARCSTPTPRAHILPPDAVQTVHLQAGGGSAPGHSDESPTTTSTPSSPDPSPAELVSALALPVPSLVICEMLASLRRPRILPGARQRRTGRYATSRTT